VFAKLKIESNDVINEDSLAFIISYDNQNDRLAAKLFHPVLRNNQKFTYLIASARYDGDFLGTVLEGNKIIASIYLVPEDKYNPNNPCDISWWRGGVGLIAAVSCSKD
jgi:hypothetical protein